MDYFKIMSSPSNDIWRTPIMVIKTVTGAGYGDEGKGLMTDYFCGKLCDKKVLNIKVNGGAQAGHTVCRIDNNNNYKHWVFRQYGSGTFAGADTYLCKEFMINFIELVKERQKLQEIYDIQNHLYIDKGCRVTLPCDVVINRALEEHRTKRHGSCGLGIYETFHRNNEIKAFKVKDVINEFISKTPDKFLDELNKIAEEHIKYRIAEIKEKDSVEISDVEAKKMICEAEKMNAEYIDALLEIIKCEDLTFSESLDNTITTHGYNAVVFECSQGLELDQFNKRNFPHLTPSNTGLKDIASIINECDTLKNCDIENCFVTRSYKTKHGAGIFVEEDTEIQSQFGLYDRTNHRNQFQGSLKYGRVNFGRLKKLIFEQLEYMNDIKNRKTSLAITHLDQTNEVFVLSTESKNYKDVDTSMFDKTYKSFGEKASDILE